MKRNYVVLTLMLLAFVFFAGTDTVNAQRFQGSLTFNLGSPQGEFNDNLDETGLGVALNYGVVLGKSPFVIGVDLGFMNYGEDSRYESIYNIPDLGVRVENRYNIFQGLAFLRLQPVKNGPIQPYAEVMAGMNYLWTETVLVDEDDWYDDETISSTNFDDAAFCWGVGGGVLIKLGGERPPGPNKRGTEFFLDLKARYLFGGKAEYLQEGSIVIDGNDVTYYYNESKTDLLNFQAGIAIKF